MHRVTICIVLLVSACARTEPPRAVPSSSCTECETLLRATILDSIDKEERHAKELAQARAGEGIAKAQAAEADAWKRWGPLGIIGAFVAGALTSAFVLRAAR